MFVDEHLGFISLRMKLQVGYGAQNLIINRNGGGEGFNNQRTNSSTAAC